MKWNIKPYWVKGGILAIPFSIVLIPLSVFIFSILGANAQGLIIFTVPEYWVAALGLGMRGTPASTVEVVTTITLFSCIFLARTFIFGSILGSIYGWFARRSKGVIFWILIILVWVSFLVFIAYRTQSPYNVYMSSQSAQDCRKTSNKGIENFGVSQCFKEVAVKNKDIRICDNIDPNPTNGAEDQKWFCYEEVAHATQDSAICELMPDKIYNDAGVETQRKERCQDWFLSH